MPKQTKLTNPLTGETLSKSEWARKLGMNRTVLDNRLKKWTLEEALNTPVGEKPSRMITHPSTGETLSITDWAKKLGINRGSLAARIDRFDWPLEKALTETAQGDSSPRMLTHPLTEETLPLVRWAIKLNKSEGTIRYQIEAGFPLEMVLTSEEEVNAITSKKLTHPISGETLAVSDWANRLGLSYWQLNARLENPSWSLEDALSFPFQGEKPPNK